MLLGQSYVTNLSRSGEHNFSKQGQTSIRLITGLGVEGDAHAGATVQHRSRVKRDPLQPNLRQIHLFEIERLQILCDNGYKVAPGDLGENITTKGIALHDLPTDALLLIGETQIQIKGLRNPCLQLDNFQPGLMQQLLGRTNGDLVRKGGVMGIVIVGGIISVQDEVAIVLPEKPFSKLVPV